MLAWMLQWNLYEPAFMVAVNVFDAPAKIGMVSKEPSAAETVCAVSSALRTVTVDPASTVSGSPNAKSLMVIVDRAAAGEEVDVDGIADDVVAPDAEGDPEREPHPAVTSPRDRSTTATEGK